MELDTIAFGSNLIKQPRKPSKDRRLTSPAKGLRKYGVVLGKERLPYSSCGPIHHSDDDWPASILSALIEQMALISDFMSVSTSRLLNSETSFHDVGGYCEPIGLANYLLKLARVFTID